MRPEPERPSRFVLETCIWPVDIICRCSSCAKTCFFVFSCQSLRGMRDQVYRIAARYRRFAHSEGVEPGANARLGDCAKDQPTLKGSSTGEPERFLSRVAQAR